MSTMVTKMEIDAMETIAGKDARLLFKEVPLAG